MSKSIRKKAECFIIIFSTFMLLISGGCATFELASKKTIVDDVEKGEAPARLYVITKDDNRYRFEDWDYEIKDDTLYGNGMMLLKNNETSFKGKIAMDSISHFEVVKYRGQTGWLIAAGVVIALYLVSLIIAQ